MRRIFIAGGCGVVFAAGLWTIQAQDSDDTAQAISKYARDAADGTAGATAALDPDCVFFGPHHDQYVEALRPKYVASHLTEDVAARLAPAIRGSSRAMSADAAGTSAGNYAGAATVANIPSAPGGSRTDTMQSLSAAASIDKEIFQKMATAGVAPAPPSTDYEFIRRITLDLTGRIPTPAAVTAFVNDTASDKRSKLVDQLLASPEWVDKWTVWFADLYENNSTNTLGANRFIQGVTAFNQFIRTSLQTGKPLNQMASEMIAATGGSSYDRGELNLLAGGVMGGGPIQDVFDAQTALVFEKFLGLAHVNCLLCHNGRGHLDALSLWGYATTRNQAYGLASFMSHTASQRVYPSGVNGQGPNYWTLDNDILVGRQDYRLDYQLNTQTGNRPARGATNSTVRVKPAYFDGEGPKAGENYRQALARKVTTDFQFARATVNYLWEYFYGIGLVSPSNQFDPYRLDPDNPPTDCPLPTNPCTLQASHPRLLNALAQEFVNSNYDIKAIMRKMVNARAYQLSSRYDGTWNPANERLFARKLVRRLWSEEVHDAITQSFASNTAVSYSGANGTWGPISWAMQLPEPRATPNATVAVFLDAFLRGNRDDQARKGDGSISQALVLMNDTFVMTRLRQTAGTNINLLTTSLKLPDDQMVNTMFMAVLSRPPSAAESTLALNNLRGLATAARTQEAQNLLWSLYNKVDFIYNY